MVGICRSVCNTWFGMYYGALVTILRILFCSLCSICMFDWDAAPHNGMPYVQMGFNMILYSVSQEECAKLRESVPYVKVYRYNPKHLRPNLNGYGDNGYRSLKL